MAVSHPGNNASVVIGFIDIGYIDHPDIDIGSRTVIGVDCRRG